jgi:hypothetical protein
VLLLLPPKNLYCDLEPEFVTKRRVRAFLEWLCLLSQSRLIVTHRLRGSAKFERTVAEFSIIEIRRTK